MRCINSIRCVSSLHFTTEIIVECVNVSVSDYVERDKDQRTQRGEEGKEPLLAREGEKH